MGEADNNSSGRTAGRSRTDSPAPMLLAQMTALLEQQQRTALAVLEFKDDEATASQTAVNVALREYIRMLFKLADAPASAFPDVQIPIELLQMIDLGAHPDEWLKAKLADLLTANELAHGKIRCVQDFATSLRQQLGLQAAMPVTDGNEENDDAPIDIS